MTVINTNIKALYTQSALKVSGRDSAVAMQQLATGKRINSSKDDAAGLAIAARMTQNIKGLNQAIRNAGDAISLIQVAEGATNEISSMLQRMSELAVQSSNSTYSAQQRQYLNEEVLQLKDGINEIARTTNWNDINLLDGSYSGSMQVGTAKESNIELKIPSMSLKSLTATTYKAEKVTQTEKPGAIYLSGFTTGDLGASNPSNKSAAFIKKITLDGQTVWTKLTESSVGSVGTTLATDSNGAIFTAGSARGSISGQLDQGDGDSFIAKYAEDGTVLWTRQFGTEASETVLSIAVSANGSVYATGESNFIYGTPQDGSDVLGTFITKYSANGEQIWYKRLSAPNGLTLRSVTATSDNGAIVVGSEVYGNQFIKKFDPQGESVWTVNLNQHLAGLDVTVGKDGFIYIAGTSSLDTNGNFIPNSNAALLIKMNQQGEVIWNKSLRTDSSYALTHSVVTDGNGFIYVTGECFGSTEGQNTLGQYDGFLAKYSPEGTELWVRQLTTSGFDVGQDLTVYEDGSVIVTGSSTSAFDGKTNKGDFDIFLTKYNADGDFIWTEQIGSEFSELSGGVATTKKVILNHIASQEETIAVSQEIDISSLSQANNSVYLINIALDSISKIRATMGVTMNRLEHVIDNLTNVVMNSEASRSQIEDADYAQASTELAKTQIQQQAATAVLAQANLSSPMVLKLLEQN
jgi:flagellin